MTLRESGARAWLGQFEAEQSGQSGIGKPLTAERQLLTDNGKEFTDRSFASHEREPSGHHMFDQLCDALGIEHRLTKPRTPQTNGMVERFNGRINDVLYTHRFVSGLDMQETLLR